MMTDAAAGKGPGDSRKGVARRPIILVAAIAFLSMATAVLLLSRPADRPPVVEPQPAHTLDEQRERGSGSGPDTARVDVRRQEDREAGDLLRLLRELLAVERVHHSGDEKREERARVRRQFTHVKSQIKDLKDQGLNGEALYLAVEERLLAGGDLEALRLLEGYRQLEQSLPPDTLDAMSPEERYEALHRARVDAFGPAVADTLFFSTEAMERYALAERRILEDTRLSEAQRQQALGAKRSALQVELASRGAYVSFADEREAELETALRQRFGASLDTMTAEERQAAVWELYRGKLPPEAVKRLEHWVAAEASRRAEMEARLQEREEILRDPDLSFHEKESRLLELNDPALARPEGQEPF